MKVERVRADSSSICISERVTTKQNIKFRALSLCNFITNDQFSCCFFYRTHFQGGKSHRNIKLNRLRSRQLKRIIIIANRNYCVLMHQISIKSDFSSLSSRSHSPRLTSTKIAIHINFTARFSLLGCFDERRKNLKYKT